MKICFITNSIEENSGGGWGRYSIDLIQVCKKENIDIKILTSKLSGNNKALERYSSPILPSHKKVLKGLIWLVINYKKIRKEISDCDAVHCLIEPYAPLTYFLCRQTPFFITIHGTFGVAFLKIKKLKLFFSLAFKKASKNICVSNFSRKELISQIRLNNTIVINNGIDFKKFYNYSALEKKRQSNFSILGVGTLKYRKGYHIAIEAIAKIKKDIPNIKYVIIGDQSDDNYFTYLKDLVKKFNIQNNVVFLTKLSDAQLIEKYYQSDLFILTPVSDRNEFEGFGLVYLEANACGLPVIGTKGCGAEDAIKDGYNGLLVNPDSEEISESILKLFNDKKIADKLGKNGIQWAKERDWQNVVKKYIKIYES